MADSIMLDKAKDFAVEIINLFKENKSTNLIISHQNRIIDIADKIILLNAGKVIAVGTKEEVIPFIAKQKCDRLREDI